MKYPREEQETIIRKGALDDYWSIYTSDSTMITKLDKLVEASDEWREDDTQTCDGEICGKMYECSGNLISFRTATVKRPGAGANFKAKKDHHDGLTEG